MPAISLRKWPEIRRRHLSLFLHRPGCFVILCWPRQTGTVGGSYASDCDRSRRFRRRLDRGGEQAQRPGQSATASLTVTPPSRRTARLRPRRWPSAPTTRWPPTPAAPLDGTGTVTVTCTKGAPAKVGLSSGSNAQGTTRRMARAATAYLTYELYKDTARTIVWGNTAHRQPSMSPRRRTRTPATSPPTDACLRHKTPRSALHRYRRGDGEFLRGRRLCDFTSSPSPSWRCCLRPHAADRVQLHRHADGGRPLDVGDQRARHVAQWQQGAAAIRNHARQLVRRRAWPDGAEPVF